MSRRKSLTKRQTEMVNQVQGYLAIEISGVASYVNNAAISLETGSLSQQQVNAIEGYGCQYDAYRVEPCGYRKICLILPEKKP